MPSLTPRARAHLRSLAHHLEPVVQVGAAGVSEAVGHAVSVALGDHELVKVRLAKALEERGQLARQLAKVADAAVVQVIGRVVVLYRRRRRDDDGRPRIELP